MFKGWLHSGEIKMHKLSPSDFAKIELLNKRKK